MSAKLNFAIVCIKSRVTLTTKVVEEHYPRVELEVLWVRVAPEVLEVFLEHRCIKLTLLHQVEADS